MTDGVKLSCSKRRNRIDISSLVDSTRALKWDESQKASSLDVLFDAMVRVARDAVSYYERVGRNKSTTSWCLRIAGVVVGTAGAMCPLLATSGWQWTKDSEITAVGYILLALAAALVGADTAFGASAGRARCVTAQLEVEALIAKSIVEWAAIKSNVALRPSSQEPARSPDSQALTLLMDFATSLFDAVRREEETWQTDFTKRIAELQGQIKSLNQGARKGPADQGEGR